MKGKFTNREIIVGAVIFSSFLVVSGFHWFGAACGVVIAPIAVWFTRDLINSVHIRPCVKRFFKRS